MHYFPSWSEWDIKWKMSWVNFSLYLASIPKTDDKDGNDPSEMKRLSADEWR